MSEPPPTLAIAGPGGPLAAALAAELSAHGWRLHTITEDSYESKQEGESATVWLIGPVEATPAAWERALLEAAGASRIPIIAFGDSVEGLARSSAAHGALAVLLAPWPVGGAALVVAGALARRQREAQEREALEAKLALVQAVLHESPLAIYAKDPHMRFVLSNRRHTALIGRPAAEILGRTDVELFGDDGVVMDAVGRTAFQTGQVQSSEFDLALQGTAHVFQELIYPIRVEGERRVGVAGIASDLTEVRRQQSQLAERVEELDRSRRVSGLTSECVELVQRCVSLDETLALTSGFLARMYPDANLAVYEKLEHHADFTLRVHERRFGAAVPRDALDHQDCWALRTRRVYAVRPGSSRIPCRHVTAADTVSACAPLLSADRLIGLLSLELPIRGAAQDAERVNRWVAQFETTVQSLAGALSTVSLRESLQQLALVDEVTELPNQRAFVIAARKSLARARRVQESVVFAMFDVESNSTLHGHWVEDDRERVLREVADIALGFFRVDDVVARLGNGTFGVALALQSVADGERRLEAFCAEIRRLCGGRQRPVHVALGFSVVAPESGISGEEALQGAELALRDAKQGGNGAIVQREPLRLHGSART